METRRVGKLISAGAAIGLFGSLVAGAPAHAASSSCYAPVPLSWCTTGSVAANPQHDIRVIVNTFCNSLWRVYDVDTDRTVAHGSGGDVNRVINGVYGRYKATVRPSCGAATIILKDI